MGNLVTYKANNMEVKLSEGIVQQFVTKGNGDITQQEAVNFIQLCRYAELNPFLNEAYLIKFGSQPAQMVVGKEAFMKRANRNKNFDGFEAGIVVLHGEEYIKKTGQAIYPNEKLMGGWARVFRKDIGHPTEVEVSLQEFSTGKSTWTKQPANMIRKVALVNALREAFPEDLGALYTEEEPHPTEAQSTVDVMPANEKTEELLADFAAEDIEEIAVAEKLNRRWITCDLGKLSYFTIQKRLLEIEKSKCLHSDKEYNEKPKSFMTCKLGMYDLKQTLEMDMERYVEFVSQLFEFERIENFINGVLFEGNKRGFPVKIFNYEKYSESLIDERYLVDLVNSMGPSSPPRVYIVSPVTRVSYIADYEEIKGTRFYFLKVPYEMIQELHKAPFIGFRQPRSKNEINAIEEMKGFQFVEKPEVTCRLVENSEHVDLVIDQFTTYSSETGEVYADEIFDKLQTREFSQEGKNRNGFIDRNQTGIRK